MNSIIYLIPIISAVIGWLTNWIAVKMIFRPFEKSRVFGIQGMIPKRRNALAQKVSEVIGETLVTRHDIQNIIEKTDIMPLIEERVLDIIDERIFTKLSKILPLVKMIPAEVVNKLRSELIDYIEHDIVNELQEKVAARIGEKALIQEIVYEKINKFSVQKLEEIILKIAHRELKAIEYLGGFIGFLIGLLQVLLIKYL